jgi:hypothetical protein
MRPMQMGIASRVLIVFGVSAALVLVKVLLFPHWGASRAWILTMAPIFFAVRWVLQGWRGADRGDASSAAQAVLAVLEVPAARLSALEQETKGANLDDLMYLAVGESPRAVVIDWRGMPSEILEAIAAAVAPLGCQLTGIGEEDEEGWAAFTLVRGADRQNLRARHDASDDIKDLMGGFARLVPELAVLLCVPSDRTDTAAYVVLSRSDAAKLQSAAGASYARWFAPARPPAAALIRPAHPVLVR